jgi:hypothetical protein
VTPQAEGDAESPGSGGASPYLRRASRVNRPYQLALMRPNRGFPACLDCGVTPQESAVHQLRDHWHPLRPRHGLSAYACYISPSAWSPLVLIVALRTQSPGYLADGGATTSSLRPASSNARRTRPDAFASSMKVVA